MKRLAYWIIFLILIGGVYTALLYSLQFSDKNKAPSEAPNYHYSYYSTEAFYDAAYTNSKPPQAAVPKNIRGLTLNHHLLAPEIIAGTLTTVATSSPLTIVVISPNHEALGVHEIQTSNYDWQTPFGVLKHNNEIVQSLLISHLVSAEEKTFETEHGITALVAFIKKSFPNAQIVPIIIKDSLSDEKSKQLAGILNSILPTNSLVIASLDFSHYLPNYVSDFHDVKAEQVFEHFDYTGIHALDIDSKPTALTFLTYLDLRNAKKSALLYHSNANEITGHFGNFENTSYLDFAYGAGKATSTDPAVTLLAFGDMMLDRYVRYQMNKYGFVYPFKNITRFLDGSDIVLANLEGPITHNPSVTLDLKNPQLTFTFDPAAVPTLKRLGFTLFGLANNHTFNFGQSGFNETKTNLASSSISYYGDPYNKTEISTIQAVRGKKIAFIGYHEFYNPDVTSVVNEIKRLKKEVDFVVVTPHWGIEYLTSFTKKQQEKAHAFIDAGADAVIGAHPHVIEPIEVYKDKPIFYSLGNFVFDQDPSFDTTHGLALGIVLKNSEVTYNLFPISVIKTQVSLPEDEIRQKILTKLAQTSEVSDNIRKEIVEGKITIITSHE